MDAEPTGPRKKLSLALAIFRLVPRGGLEDHAIRIATELYRRGHEVTLFVAGAAPALPVPVRVVRLPRALRKWANHRKMEAFARDVRAATVGNFDRTVAFQTIPGVDVLFHADRLRDSHEAPAWKRLTPRFRTFAELEAGCFRPGARTKIIGLSPQQLERFVDRYGTESSRLRIAPVTLCASKCDPASRNDENRSLLRAALGLDAAAPVWLWLGLAPMTKGLDRVLDALAQVPEARLLVGGLSATDRGMLPMVRRARTRDVERRVHCLGYLTGDALHQAMAASDVLAHPARADVTGGVILESILNGLPVVASEVCGFAPHVRDSGAGAVLSEPFDPEELVLRLRQVGGPENSRYSANGLAYGKRTELFSGIETVCRLIEADAWEADQPVHGPVTASKNRAADASQLSGRYSFPARFAHDRRSAG